MERKDRLFEVLDNLGLTALEDDLTQIRNAVIEDYKAEQNKNHMVGLEHLKESFLAGFQLANSLNGVKSEKLRQDMLSIKDEISNEIIKLLLENASLKGELIGTLKGMLHHIKDPGVINNIEKRIAELEK